MKIYLVRHGEVDQDTDFNRYEKRRNYQLNNLGVMQANNLKNKIKDMNFDACFTSPLLRAWSTAIIIVGDRIEIKEDSRLMERYLGEYEDGTQSERFKDNLDKYYDYKLNSSDHNVEPIQDLYKRCNDFLSYLKDNYSDDSKILIVSHHGIIKTMHNIINKNKLDGILEEIKIENCSIREYDI